MIITRFVLRFHHFFYCHGNVNWLVNSIKNSARILIGIVQKLYLDQFGKRSHLSNVMGGDQAVRYCVVAFRLSCPG